MCVCMCVYVCVCVCLCVTVCERERERYLSRVGAVRGRRVPERGWGERERARER